MHAAHRARETVDHLRKKNTRLYSDGPVASKYLRSEPNRLQDPGYHATSRLSDKNL